MDRLTASTQTCNAQLPVVPPSRRDDQERESADQRSDRSRFSKAQPASDGPDCYGWITVSVRLITNASRRSTKSVTTSAKASGRSALIACPAS
jgi:hypothetical protein